VNQPALHLVSAFATTGGLVLGQEAVSEKSTELSAIPVLLARLGAGGGLKGAVVSIDAVACTSTIAQHIRDEGADYLLAVKANQPTLLRDVEALFKEVPTTSVERSGDIDKGHGRTERRDLSYWACGANRPLPSPISIL
jgi:predicted transposase YbfD/YdcC